MIKNQVKITIKAMKIIKEKELCLKLLKEITIKPLMRIKKLYKIIGK